MLANMSLGRRFISLTLQQTKKQFRSHRSLSSKSPYILDSDYQDVAIPKVSVSEYMFEKMQKYSNFTAAECASTGRKYTYEQIIRKSRNLSKSLRKKLGLKQGDVVAVLLPNIPEFPIATLGLNNAGLVITTINPLYTCEEISRQLTDSSAKVVITLISLNDTVVSSLKLLRKSLPIITIKTEQHEKLPQNAIDFNEFVENSIGDDPSPRLDSEDVVFLPYSSGTTGLPKGVQLTNRNIVANICQNGCPEMPYVNETTSEYQDVIPVVLPMFHIYGFTVNSMFVLSKGTKMVTMTKFTMEDYVAMLRNHKPNILFLVPPIALFLAAHPMVKEIDLQSVRIVFSGAAPLGRLDEERLMEKAKNDLYVLQGYGLTETSPTVTAVSINLKNRLDAHGSIGVPLPQTSVKIIEIDDPKGEPLGPNKTGELLVKGPQVMKGYLNRPEENKNIFLDGWLRTGDMAYYNDDKLLYITDRLKELIKVKGFQVPPAELEEIIRAFPNVSEAAVIGIPHEINGEVPRAYIVPKKDTKVDVGDLETYVNGKVASYKQLKGGIKIVESIPKNASGKILRRTLKLQYLETK